jgi:6-phosphogluconolactonase
MRFIRFRIGLLGLAVVLASSCGGGSSMSTPPPTALCKPAPQPKFAYVLNYTDAAVSMYTVHSCTGALSPTTPATIPVGIDTGINAESMVVDPAGRFLYVANLVSNATDQATISMFTINPSTGVLTPTTPAMVSTGFYPQGITVDPLGKILYTANSDDNTISMFTINQSSGVLTPTTPASISVPPLFSSRSLISSPDFVTVDPTGLFLYASDQDNGSISTFAINSSTGVLTPTAPARVDAGPNPYGVAIAPSGKFAYVSDEDMNMVWMYTVDSNTGVLTSNPAFAVPAGNQPAWMAVDPSSKFAYAVIRYDGTVSMYTIDPNTGSLTPNTPATIKAGSWPFPIVLNASGTFAYVANQNDDSVSIFRINGNGVLAAAGTAQTGTDPVAIALTR